MSRAVLLFSVALLLSGNAYAETISAKLASASVPTPTFDDVHEQFMRIVVNESGWVSDADADGISRALVSQGGGRDHSRRGRGQGYGLDYSRLMRQMALHSTRTFPSGSKFLVFAQPWRIAKARRHRTYQNEWAATLNLDCDQPRGWQEERSGSWLGYIDRCAGLVRRTGEWLRGDRMSHCSGDPTTWGGGRLNLFDEPQDDWREIYCDHPEEGRPPCDDLSLAELRNSRTCARNRFWSWLPDGGGSS